MRIAVTGTISADSKLIANKLDHLTSKLNKPTFMFVPPCHPFLVNWLFSRLYAYMQFWEGLEAMIEEADVLIAFNAHCKESRSAIKLAENRGIKIKRVE